MTNGPTSSETTQLATVTPILPAVVTSYAAEPAPAAVNPLKQAHVLLRGRYWLAVTLAVLGLLSGTLAGYFLSKPLYQSVGLIRVQPYLQKILYESDQTGMLPNYDVFIGSQVELIRSERVTAQAMLDPEWEARGRGRTPEVVVKFRESLGVKRSQGSELILVSFEDEDPEAAQIAVKSVIKAYEALYGERSGESVNDRILALEGRRLTLESELRSYSTRIHSLAADFGGSEAMEQVYQFKLTELNKLEAELRRVELALAVVSGGEGRQVRAGNGATSRPADEALEVMAARIPGLEQLLAARRAIERKLRLDRTRYGARHRSVIEGESQLEIADREIQDMVETHDALADDPSAQAIGSGWSKSAAQLALEEQNVRALYENARKETLELGRKVGEIEKHIESSEDVKARLAETRSRLEELEFERKAGGRINIESTGDRPLSPSKDKRIQFAAAGGMGLGGAGVGLVLLLGFIDRRVRVLSDVKGEFKQLSRVLGVLPQLSERAQDSEQAILAAHGVHQIRTALQGRHGPDDHPVVAITSPSPGSGKTSLTLALGMSFAASGSRTLMIDCDIIGGGLTSKLKDTTRRRLGHILRREGVISSDQLVDALKIRAGREQPLGEILIELGHATPEQVNEALQMQDQTHVGLLEALGGEPFQECIADTGSKRLYLLPLGMAERHHAGELSQVGLRRLIGAARKWFDVIIIDTGPVLGSLEATVAARVADEVVLTVTRGEARASIERSLEHLASAGAHVTGVVFNRAARTDIRSSGFSSSLSRESSRSTTLPDCLPLIEHKHLRLGPVATAVASIAQLPSRHLQN